jgi:hypothetical protein
LCIIHSTTYEADRLDRLPEMGGFNSFFQNLSSPGGVGVTSLARHSFANAQSLHHAHDCDLVPDITAAWRLDAAVSQRLRNLAKDGPQIRISGITQTNWPPANPGRFTIKPFVMRFTEPRQDIEHFVFARADVPRAR